MHERKLKENGFQLIKSMINDKCYSSVCSNLFRASQKLCQVSKSHLLFARHGKLVLKFMLVPALYEGNEFIHVEST